MVPISAPDQSPLAQRVESLLTLALPACGVAGLVVELDDPPARHRSGAADGPVAAECPVRARDGVVRGRVTAHGAGPVDAGRVGDHLVVVADVVGDLVAADEARRTEQELRAAVALTRDAERLREERGKRLRRHLVHRTAVQVAALRGALAEVAEDGGAAGIVGDASLVRAAVAARDVAGILADVGYLLDGVPRPDPAPHRLEDLVHEALEEIADSVGGPSAAEVRVVSARDVRLMVDGDAVRSALRHVLEGARRAAEDPARPHPGVGGPVIEIDAVPQGDTCLVSIEDGGGAERAGLLRRQLVAGPGGLDEGDAGLAIGIVRAVAEAHGGRCWVEKGSRAGARVCLTLPTLPTADVDDLAARRHPASAASPDPAATTDPTDPTASSGSVEDPPDNVRELFARGTSSED